MTTPESPTGSSEAVTVAKVPVEITLGDLELRDESKTRIEAILGAAIQAEVDTTPTLQTEVEVKIKCEAEVKFK